MTSALWLWKLSRMNVQYKCRMDSNQHCHTHLHTLSTLPCWLVQLSYSCAAVLCVFLCNTAFSFTFVPFTQHHSNQLILTATYCECYSFFVSVVNCCILWLFWRYKGFVCISDFRKDIRLLFSVNIQWLWNACSFSVYLLETIVQCLFYTKTV